MQRTPPIDHARPGEPEGEGSLFARASTLAGAGVIVSIATALPGAVRVIGDGDVVRALEQWVILSGITAPLAALFVAVVLRASVGLRLLVAERARAVATGVLWWAVVELGLLAPVAAVLRKATHQHALAGVTFAAFAIVSGIVVGIFAMRATAAFARGGTSGLSLGMAAGCAALVVLLVAGRTSRAEDMHTAAAILDAIAFAGVTALVSSRPVQRFRPLGLIGVPAFVLAVLLGVMLLRFEPETQEGFARAAPLHAFVLEVFR
jgi:hypothetical protein